VDISFFLTNNILKLKEELGRRNPVLTDGRELVLVHPGLHRRAHPLHLHLILLLNQQKQEEGAIGYYCWML
jgi:hypothetical protein